MNGRASWAHSAISFSKRKREPLPPIHNKNAHPEKLTAGHFRSLIESLRFEESNGAALLGTFTLILVQNLFPQAQALVSCFDVFIYVDVFQRAFQAQLQRSAELNAFAVAV